MNRKILLKLTFNTLYISQLSFLWFAKIAKNVNLFSVKYSIWKLFSSEVIFYRILIIWQKENLRKPLHLVSFKDSDILTNKRLGIFIVDFNSWKNTILSYIIWDASCGLWSWLSWLAFTIFTSRKWIPQIQLFLPFKWMRKMKILPLKISIHLKK